VLNIHFSSRDNVPSLVLNSWDISADLLDDEFLDGVMPVLFAEDPKMAEEGLMQNIDAMRKDLERLAKVYFVPETLNLEQAEAVVKKPRLGEVLYLFKAQNLERVFAGKITYLTVFFKHHLRTFICTFHILKYNNYERFC
jgi:hypothetical protein